ncbi:hypothetical protein Tco_1426773 [Tanacetum coccineum]
MEKGKALKEDSEEDVAFMTRQVTNKEIKQVVFDIYDNKASGLDEYTVKFFKKAWNRVRRDECDAVRELFANGRML